MKTLWNALCVIAIANMLALGGFAVWLRTTDRLDMGRAREVRVLMSKTLSQEKAEAVAEAAAEAQKVKDAEAAARETRPPLSASEQLLAKVEASEIDRQRAERLKVEIEGLRTQLAMERAKLDTERDTLAADRKAFEAQVESTFAQANEAQFQKTLGVLVGLKPNQTATMLKELIDAPQSQASEIPEITANKPSATAGASPTRGPGFAQAVSYLDAMDDRPRGKIIAEFLKTDPALATDLLEHLRTRAQFARVR